MSKIPRLVLGLKALTELGPKKVGLYSLYRLGLRSHFLAWRTPPQLDTHPPEININYPVFSPCLDEIGPLIAAGKSQSILAEAGEIGRGQVHLFGGPPVPLNLAGPFPLTHWSAYELGQVKWGEETDLKRVWEPARFGWAYTLARAYGLSSNDAYAQAFWRHFETFQAANPPNLGPHWMSAQEVALRLMAFIFAGQIFLKAPSTTPGRLAALSSAVASHARRIPPTLIYARSQNNNHLISEAAGLYSAGCALPSLPEASGWRRQGLKWLNQAFQTQILEDGTYLQHSTNYHRLILQLAFWVSVLKSPDSASPLTDLSRQRLAAATHWLCRLVDPETGQAPNLGANDGAYIMPLAGDYRDHNDYRPVLQACAKKFLGQPALQPGAWDEMGLWFGLPQEKSPLVIPSDNQPSSSVILIAQPGPHPATLAYLHTAHFTDRPSHADQLNVDLWWHNLNIAKDAGTYLYNGPQPWNNSLAQTAVHNTVQIDGKDQMTRAGRFLWLDWAQASIIQTQAGPDGKISAIEATHDGYRKAGISHIRSLTMDASGGCRVIDRVGYMGRKISKTPHRVRLHWLLPDWGWELRETTLSVKSPFGWINLSINLENQDGLIPTTQLRPIFFLVRAGEIIYPPPEEQTGASLLKDGKIAGLDPTILGWVSETYAKKTPAVSLAIYHTGALPVTFFSQWTFPQRYSRNP